MLLQVRMFARAGTRPLTRAIREIEGGLAWVSDIGNMDTLQLNLLAERQDLEGILSLAKFVAEKKVKDRVSSPDDVAALVMYDMAKLEQEELWVVLCNTRNAVMDIHKLYRGSANTSLVRLGELFREAIRKNAAAIIVVHNHPSGDPTPSPEDVNLTRAAVEAGKLLDIEVLDHLIIGNGQFVSLKARGLGFGE